VRRPATMEILRASCSARKTVSACVFPVSRNFRDAAPDERLRSVDFPTLERPESDFREAGVEQGVARGKAPTNVGSTGFFLCARAPVTSSGSAFAHGSAVMHTSRTRHGSQLEHDLLIISTRMREARHGAALIAFWASAQPPSRPSAAPLRARTLLVLSDEAFFVRQDAHQGVLIEPVRPAPRPAGATARDEPKRADRPARTSEYGSP